MVYCQSRTLVTDRRSVVRGGHGILPIPITGHRQTVSSQREMCHTADPEHWSQTGGQWSEGNVSYCRSRTLVTDRRSVVRRGRGILLIQTTRAGHSRSGLDLLVTVQEVKQRCILAKFHLLVLHLFNLCNGMFWDIQYFRQSLPTTFT